MNTDIIILHSGLLEKYKCTIEEIKHTFYLYQQTQLFERFRNRPIDDIFLNTMGLMTISLEEVNELFLKTIEDNKKFLLEAEIKKTNGNYDEWIEQLGGGIAQQEVDSVFDDFSRNIPANSNLPQFN